MIVTQVIEMIFFTLACLSVGISVFLMQSDIRQIKENLHNINMSIDKEIIQAMAKKYVLERTKLEQDKDTEDKE